MPTRKRKSRLQFSSKRNTRSKRYLNTDRMLERGLIERIKLNENLDVFQELPADRAHKYTRNARFLLKLLKINTIETIHIVQYIDHSLMNDSDFILNAIKYRPNIMEYVPKALFKTTKPNYDSNNEPDYENNNFQGYHFMYQNQGYEFIMSAYRANKLSILYLPEEEYMKYPIIKRLANEVFESITEGRSFAYIENLELPYYHYRRSLRPTFNARTPPNSGSNSGNNS